MSEKPRLSLRTRAAVTLGALACLGFAALVVRVPPPRRVDQSAPTTSLQPSPERADDIEMFQSIVGRLRRGEPYYETLGDELRRRRYPAAQVFNWRTPLLFSGLALTGESVARAALVGLGMLMCAATLTLHPVSVAVVSGLMQLGGLTLIVVPFALFLGESWAGLLIGLSLCAYIWQRTFIAVSLGIAALFIRELTAPYCVVCTIAAVYGRRWKEACAWLGGGLLYGMYYARHVAGVSAERLPTDVAHSAAWVQFGGLPSVLEMLRWHRLMLISPRPVLALVLLLIVAGTLNHRAPLHLRLTSAAYLVFFMVAGQTFNGYWGLVAWPAWALACGYGAQNIAEMLRIVRQPLQQDPPLLAR